MKCISQGKKQQHKKPLKSLLIRISDHFIHEFTDQPRVETHSYFPLNREQLQQLDSDLCSIVI